MTQSLAKAGLSQAEQARKAYRRAEEQFDAAVTRAIADYRARMKAAAAMLDDEVAVSESVPTPPIEQELPLSS